jgi:pimeloyl-ACP methyl ester carboxylesterase
MYRTAYRTADVDGLKVFYRDAGPPDAPAILLLHGFPSSSRMWQPLLVLWGRYDPSFQVEEAEAYRREVPAAEVHILDACHFALDEQPDAIADLTRGFLGRPTRNDRLR